MAAEQTPSQDRTESATPRRREQARSEGRVARSAELSAAASMLAGTALLAILGGPVLAAFATRTLRESARTLALGPMSAPAAVGLLRTVTQGFILALLPFTL